MAKKRNKFRFKLPLSCQGEKHYIALSKKGRIALLDHQDSVRKVPLERWEAWADMGGRVPSCQFVMMRIIELLYTAQDYSDLPAEWPTALRQFICPAIETRRARRAKRERAHHQRPRHIHGKAKSRGQGSRLPVSVIRTYVDGPSYHDDSSKGGVR